MTKSTNTPERGPRTPEREPATPPAMSRRQIVMSAAGIATAGVVATWIYSLTRPPQAETVAQPVRQPGRLSLSQLTEPGPMPELVLGKEDAPVTIVEYADLTCPACAAFHSDVLPKVKEKYIDTGKAKLLFREFPTNTPSIIAFMAVRCVEPAKAHPLISALFSRQADWRGSASFDQLRDKLFALGQQVGLTRQAFDACVPNVQGDKVQLTAEQKKLVQNITTVRDRGHQGFGVNATPTFFVDGKRLSGSSLEDFDKAIEPALNP